MPNPKRRRIYSHSPHLSSDPGHVVTNARDFRIFNKDSDVDFSVIFDLDSLPLSEYGENYFDFKYALEDLLHRDVDLIEYNAVRNPYFKEELDETKRKIYGQTS